MRAGDRNAAWAGVFVDELVRAGVAEASIAPGSRSTPLVLALARTPEIRVTTHVDERSAAFFALGVGKRSGTPAVVVTTSGTAAANLLPAVVEASWSEAPLLLCTADRPPHLRGADANQAIDQIGLFGRYVREFVEVAPPSVEAPAVRHLRALAVRAVASAVGAPAGPVHLNFPFPKPLEPTGAGDGIAGELADELGGEDPLAARGRPDGAPLTAISRRRAAPDPGAVESTARRLRQAERVLVVAGPAAEARRAGPAVLELARLTGFPLLADPLSGARFGPGAREAALGRYDLFLRDEGVRRRLAPDAVLRIGSSPTSAPLQEYLAHLADVPQLVVDAGARWKDHRAAADEYLRADPSAFCRELAAALGGDPSSADLDWAARWRRAEEAAREAVAGELVGDFFEGKVLARIPEVLPGGSTLVVSSSMPVRDLDAFAGPGDEPLHVVGNRGASGIDGMVSTALGAARAGRSDGPVVAVLGDLALCHDMNGLLAARKHGIPVTFVVVNNDGGGIFHFLPVRRFEPEFTRHFAVPHGLDFGKAAELYGLPHFRVRPGDDLGDLLADGLEAGQSRILEVASDREANRERLEEVRASAAAAAREALEAGGGGR